MNMTDNIQNLSIICLAISIIIINKKLFDFKKQLKEKSNKEEGNNNV
jgi:hypothetical protein